MLPACSRLQVITFGLIAGAICVLFLGGDLILPALGFLDVLGGGVIPFVACDGSTPYLGSALSCCSPGLLPPCVGCPLPGALHHVRDVDLNALYVEGSEDVLADLGCLVPQPAIIDVCQGIAGGEDSEGLVVHSYMKPMTK